MWALVKPNRKREISLVTWTPGFFHRQGIISWSLLFFLRDTYYPSRVLAILVHPLSREEDISRASIQEALTGATPRLGCAAPKDNSPHIHTLRQASYKKQRGRKSACVHEHHRVTWPQNKQQWSAGTESHFLDSCVGKRKAAKLHSQLRLPILRSDRKSNNNSLILCNHNENKRNKKVTSSCSATHYYSQTVLSYSH